MYHQLSLLAKRLGLLWCTTIPSLVTKDWTVQNIPDWPTHLLKGHFRKSESGLLTKMTTQKWDTVAKLFFNIKFNHFPPTGRVLWSLKFDLSCSFQPHSLSLWSLSLSLTHTHTHTFTCMRACTHACMHRHTHTYTHSHTHTNISTSLLNSNNKLTAYLCCHVSSRHYHVWF